MVGYTSTTQNVVLAVEFSLCRYKFSQGWIGRISRWNQRIAMLLLVLVQLQHVAQESILGTITGLSVHLPVGACLVLGGRQVHLGSRVHGEQQGDPWLTDRTPCLGQNQKGLCFLQHQVRQEQHQQPTKRIYYHDGALSL